LSRDLTLLELRRKKAIEAAQAQERLNKANNDGVARFRSTQQAVGIAGREFQQAGFRVSENPQFGGVTPGVHEGAGHAQGRAIDINVGKGVVEANVPDVMARLNAMAVRYAARGYIVLWNGKRYDPSGKVTPFPGHYDHMHLEAPQAIVGKPTQASSEAQARREEEAGAKVAERAEDFVDAIKIKAAGEGLPADRQTQLNAQIDEALAQFTRKFEREATAGEKAEITKAFTDADARDTARRFEEAYVDPLKRLQDLQGKTGVDRAILNAKLEETARLGRELTPVEAQMIENGIRHGDQLQRQAQLLEQIRGPMDNYRATIEALNALLAKGAISLEAYNARMTEMIANAANATIGGLQGVDPNTGQDYEQLTAIADENARYAEQLNNFREYREQLLQLGISYDAALEAAHRQHSQNMALIDQAREERRLSGARQFFGQLAQLQSSKNRELAAIGKAAAITQATIDAYLAINKALATLPPPWNIAMAVAIGATALANVATIAGLRQGGYTGDQGENQVAGMVPVHGKEFVVNARGTRENRSLLEAINSGRQVRQVMAGNAREAGMTTMTQAAPVVVPAPVVNLRTINVTDARMVEDYFTSPEGEQTFVNLVNRNADTIRRAATGDA
jgi:hypothetical protein